jgi:hypothetical protein
MSVKGGPAGGQPGEEEGKGTGDELDPKLVWWIPLNPTEKGEEEGSLLNIQEGRTCSEYTVPSMELSPHSALTLSKWRTCVDATQLSLISIAVWKYKRDKLTPKPLLGTQRLEPATPVCKDSAGSWGQLWRTWLRSLNMELSRTGGISTGQKAAPRSLSESTPPI